MGPDEEEGGGFPGGGRCARPFLPATERSRWNRGNPAVFVVTGYSPKGHCVLIDAAIKDFLTSSHLALWSGGALSRTEAPLKDAEMQKKRVPRTMVSIQERNAISIPLPLSENGALGPAAYSFHKMAFVHAKIASEFSMRHSHAAAASTWPTIWLSTYCGLGGMYTPKPDGNSTKIASPRGQRWRIRRVSPGLGPYISSNILKHWEWPGELGFSSF